MHTPGREVTLTKSEAIALLLLLKSITYEGLSGEEATRFQATLFNLGERIEIGFPGAGHEQYELWERLGRPGWENTIKTADA